MQRRLLLLALILTSLYSVIPAPASAQLRSRCFKETGFCVAGTILDYWERNGGLAVFGYPITEQRTEGVEESWTGPVQWFERDRLEDHSNEGKGILAGRLGARFLELQGRAWQPGMPMPHNPDCTFFKQTGYNVCGTFRSYWERNGGLARFGYPITDPAQETVEGKTYWVQYFERRRMELHPENSGTPYEILLGLLGREVYAVEGDRQVIQPTPGDLPAAIQQPILNAAYAALRANYPRTKLAVGLIDVTGEYAAVLAQPLAQKTVYVYLHQRADGWHVIEATTAPSAEILRRRGIPESLWANSDAKAVVAGALAHIQDLRGEGLNAFVTRPRIAGDMARLWVTPAAAENLDSVTMFLKREGGVWRYLSAGSAYPEDDLRELGVPQELWPYGENVRGPAS